MRVTLSVLGKVLPELKKKIIQVLHHPPASGEGPATISEEFILIIYVFAFKGTFTNTRHS